MSKHLKLILLITIALTTLYGADPNSAFSFPSKAPFKVLYSNDTTHILTCTSPYHQRKAGFRPEMLEASVDETAGTGVDVHMLQPGMGWVPWWKSKSYPYSDHVQWMKERYGAAPPKGSFAEYMANGGDLVGVFVKRCREKRLVPFISLRMNDGHGLEDAFVAKGTKLPQHAWHTLSRFYETHPEYRIGSNPNVWEERVLNWAIPEVPEYRLRFIEEICTGYDIDGLELDFMRYYSYFRPGETSLEERKAIMVRFVGEVRRILDRTAKQGKHRWLCVRVPALLEMHDPLGIDLPEMVRVGVEMVNLSASYFTEQQTDYAKIRRLVPDAAVYLEMTHSIYNLKSEVKKVNYDNFRVRRVTDEQFYTTAHLAYSKGLDGVSLFNFPYYREYAVPEFGPFYEPPFQVLQHLGDPQWLARQPQHYFLASGFVPRGYSRRSLPAKFKAGQSRIFTLDLASPRDGWQENGKIRIQSDHPLNSNRWIASLNGVTLSPTADCGEPYPSRYQPLLGDREYHRAWVVPYRLLKEGSNTLEVTLQDGQPANLIYLDLAIR